ncbi:tRNA (adenosine(37)-N6)-threonylcarbamoyltransferase complex ATPase subunit type 1 TsaE [Zymomonas sp.]|uniref:tRNA (adenosine(37)-N6)-threonylcarbamoyltransferase complex ATPase subunit type 1 TsaE n=1 Tax=Zymomonas sp. TaxID=2068624 RepID=UPI0025E0F076|nr:tRNA (adenosine(37)-N6)-threonylcarbamoyltransferase complex ATPase subunit type 1 TsaE [Zymomonas sp.]MCA1955608.1 tRNA (adenosine(37)-N6)-threonylcarbamoyltransferase complex ATPase subunit type 1 TsaE [Zymomonas sp.]
MCLLCKKYVAFLDDSKKMSIQEIILADAAATEEAGRYLGRSLQTGDIITLSGDLGAGKTSLARGILSELGFQEEVPSPSFALMIDYEPPEVSLPVAHVDLYRLDNPEDIQELGLDEFAFYGALLVEWPERLGQVIDQIWPDRLALHLDILEDNRRRLTWQRPSYWENRWPPLEY